MRKKQGRKEGGERLKAGIKEMRGGESLYEGKKDAMEKRFR